MHMHNTSRHCEELVQRQSKLLFGAANPVLDRFAWLAMTRWVKLFCTRLRETLRLMIGIPDYERYVAHMRAKHPDQEPMSYEAFFRERQDARFGGKGDIRRCC